MMHLLARLMRPYADRLVQAELDRYQREAIRQADRAVTAERQRNAAWETSNRLRSERDGQRVILDQHVKGCRARITSLEQSALADAHERARLERRWAMHAELEKADLLAELRLLRGKNATAELELAELDRENAALAGRLRTAEEQLAAATLEGQP